MTPFNNQTKDDREWLAFRYIAGELSGDETVAFEAELETSQVVREAVARAVELSQAVAIAESQQVVLVEAAPRGIRSRSWIPVIGWITAGAVAASVAGAVWWNMPGFQSDNSSIAENWAAMRAVDPPAPSVEAPAELGPALDAADAAPSWMTAGVISLSGGKVEDDGDGDGKPDGSWDDEVMEN
ncbi:MAG: hypothetical protein ACKVP0_27250 [Pirellulaceae bacterium]